MKTQHLASLKLTWLLYVPLFLFAVSCRRSDQARTVAAPDSPVVAVVGGAAISAESFKKELQRRFPQASSEEPTASQKKSVLESLIRNETLYANAVKEGFDRNPEVEEAIKALIIARFKERQFTPAEIAATDQEIETYYRSQATRFTTSEAARGAVIFIASPATATAEKRAETRARAEAIASEAKATPDELTFARLVARSTEDQATRYRGGETGWVSPNSPGFAPEVVKALLALKEPNEFAPLVETARGFWVVKLLERREPAQQPLVQVKDLLRHELSRQKAERAERDFYARMAQGLNIHVNQTLLDSIKLPLERLTPPKLPGERTAQIEPQHRL